MELALSLEKLNFIKLRELHRVASNCEDAQLADFIGESQDHTSCALRQSCLVLISWIMFFMVICSIDRLPVLPFPLAFPLTKTCFAMCMVDSNFCPLYGCSSFTITCSAVSSSHDAAALST